jgi:Arc/MetJ family transcription regulator
MARTRTVVRFNSRLVDEAARVLGAKSRTDAVRVALREIVALSSFKKLMKEHAASSSSRVMIDNVLYHSLSRLESPRDYHREIAFAC